MERTRTFLFIIIFLGVSINGVFSQGQQHLLKKTRSSAVVVGTVYCDTCFNGAFSKSPNHLIPGALVAVECVDENSKPSFRREVKTDEHGEFKAKLPFSVSKHVRNIKRCSVKLLSSSQPYCSIAASATSSSLKRLRTSKHGDKTRVFSAGFFTFKPENQPEICSQKLINPQDTKPLLPDPTFPPPIKDPVPNPSPLPIPKLPVPIPMPDLPIPNIPLVPPVSDLLPQIPPILPPGPQKSVSLRNKKVDSLDDKKTKVPNPNFSFLHPNQLFPPLIPNPLNPPSLIPPIPLIPSPPTLPPLPFVPSPATPQLPIPLPPIPGLTPPPTTPQLPLPLPPIPGLTPPPATPQLPLPLPPVPNLPPLPTLPTLPPLPGVTPPPSPPPPQPSLPIPLPPLIPGLPPLMPGVPPASTSFSNHKQP